MSKIGFHFVNTLPATINEEESKSFFYVKKEIARLDSNNQPVIDKFAEVFLGTRNAGGNVTFHSLTPPVNFYGNKINGVNLLTNYEKHPNIGVNINLNDICNYQTDNNITSTSLIFNDDVVLSKKYKTLFFSNVKNKPVNVLETNGPNLIFGLDIGSNSSTYNFNNNLIVGNNIKFVNTELNDNLIFGTDIELSSASLNGNKTVRNNLFLGGIHINTSLATYITEHKIQDNIFIRNLGYGNLNTNFHMSLPLKLSTNTELVETALIPNYPRVAVVKNDGTIGIVEKSLYFPTPSFNDVVTKGNSTNLTIKIQNAIISNQNNNLTITNKILTDLSSSTIIGTEFNNQPTIFFSTITGKDNATNSLELRSSVIYGSFNLNFNENIANNIVYGNNNLNNSSGPTDTSNNIIFGYDNYKFNFIGDNNITFGRGNFTSNEGSNNIVVGYNNGNNITDTIYSNKVIIGSDIVVQNSTDELIIGKSILGEQVQLIVGSFTQKSLKLNSTIKLDFDKIPNSTNNILYTKVLTATQTGEIGFENKPKTNNSYSTDETLTGGTWIDGRPIYSKTIVGNIDAGDIINLGGGIGFILPIEGMVKTSEESNTNQSWININSIQANGYYVQQGDIYLAEAEVTENNVGVILLTFKNNNIPAINKEYVLTVRYLKSYDISNINM